MLCSLDEDDSEALDEHHTHFVLFDIGYSYRYLDDTPRSNFAKAACTRTDSQPVQVQKNNIFIFLLEFT